jgi:hypothetical protein
MRVTAGLRMPPPSSVTASVSAVPGKTLHLIRHGVTEMNAYLEKHRCDADDFEVRWERGNETLSEPTDRRTRCS